MVELTEVQELQIAVEGLRRHLGVFSIEILAEVEKMQTEIKRLIAVAENKS